MAGRLRIQSFPRYRVSATDAGVPACCHHDHTGDDLGLVEHPAPDLEPSDVVALADSEALCHGPAWKPNPDRSPRY